MDASSGGFVVLVALIMAASPVRTHSSKIKRFTTSMNLDSDCGNISMIAFLYELQGERCSCLSLLVRTLGGVLCVLYPLESAEKGGMKWCCQCTVNNNPSPH